MARFGSFEVDPGRRRLFRGGEIVHLTPKAFDLLIVLIEAAPRVVTKTELHRRLWPHTVVSDATLVGLVKELRRAVADWDGSIQPIRTAHRIGYAFDAPVQRESPPARASSTSRWLTTGDRRILLAEGEYVIGRDPEAHIRLDYSTVSRRHARLLVADVTTVLEDLGSKNGTTIDGARVTTIVLRDGIRFSCGQIPLVYRESDALLPTATQLS